MDVNSLAHTKWECKYHIVFAPKYRRQIIYKAIRADVGEILGSLCRRKGIKIIEAECCSDHIHMLVRIPPKYSVSEIVGYLKGKSSLMIFERHANLKYKYGNRNLVQQAASHFVFSHQRKLLDAVLRDQRHHIRRHTEAGALRLQVVCRNHVEMLLLQLRTRVFHHVLRFFSYGIATLLRVASPLFSFS